MDYLCQIMVYVWLISQKYDDVLEIDWDYGMFHLEMIYKITELIIHQPVLNERRFANWTNLLSSLD